MPLCCPFSLHPFFSNMWTLSLEKTKIQAAMTHIWHDSVCPSVTFPCLYCNFKFASELGLARASYITFPANLVLRIASPVCPPLTSQLPDGYPYSFCPLRLQCSPWPLLLSHTPHSNARAEAENLGSESFPSGSHSVTRNSKHICETGNNIKTACKQRACIKTKPRGRKFNGIQHKSRLFSKSAIDS